MNIKLYQPLAIHEMGNRKNQEDFICPMAGKATPNDRLFIVCDGMGGHEHGEVASKTFAMALARFFEAQVSPDLVLSDTTLADAIDNAYAALDAADDGSYKKMGTTLTLVYFHRGGVTAAHIGDSRIYHIRPNEGLLYVSRDHSLVYDLYQSGEISYDEIKTSDQKNIITRAVQPGEDNRVKPDIIHITDIQPGDFFYLCSDGMIELMDDEELMQILSAKGSNEKKRQQLIAATADNNDNHSAYLIQIEDVIRESDDALLGVNEEKTARCNALNMRQVKPVIHNDAVEVANAEQSTEYSIPEHKVKRRLWPLIIAILAVALAVVALLFGMRNQSSADKPIADYTDTVVAADSVKPIRPISHATPKRPNETDKNVKQQSADKQVQSERNTNSNVTEPLPDPSERQVETSPDKPKVNAKELFKRPRNTQSPQSPPTVQQPEGDNTHDITENI